MSNFNHTFGLIEWSAGVVPIHSVVPFQNGRRGGVCGDVGGGGAARCVGHDVQAAARRIVGGGTGRGGELSVILGSPP